MNAFRWNPEEWVRFETVREGWPELFVLRRLLSKLLAGEALDSRISGILRSDDPQPRQRVVKVIYEGGYLYYRDAAGWYVVADSRPYLAAVRV